MTELSDVTKKLFEAVVNENTTPEQLKELIDAGADVNYRSREGSTALMEAVYESENRDSRKVLIRHLINAGANVNARDNENRTALMWAIRNSENTAQQESRSHQAIIAGRCRLQSTGQNRQHCQRLRRTQPQSRNSGIFR